MVSSRSSGDSRPLDSAPGRRVAPRVGRRCELGEAGSLLVQGLGCVMGRVAPADFSTQRQSSAYRGQPIQVRQTLSLGSHDLFLGEIVAVQADKEVLDAGGRIDLRRVDAFAYGNGSYWPLGKAIGAFGFGAQK